MSYLIIPENYKPLMSMQQTEQGIKLIKEFFQQNLSTGLQLRRVTAPLFVLKGMGINDDLNGSLSRIWVMPRPRLSIHLPNGSVLLWQSTISSPVMASIPI